MSDRTIVHDNTMLFRGKEACPTYLVLLDQPLDGRIVKSLWDLAMMRVCVDGGANYLLQACPDLVPDAIVGDMKGITERTRREYEGRDVTIVEDKSTECSDLDKALTWLRDHVDNTGEAQVMLYMGEGGRFDRIMCGINDLFLGCVLRGCFAFQRRPAAWLTRASCSYDFKRLVLLSRETMMFLLPTGRSQIKRFTKVEQKYCGMLPVGT